MESSLDQGCSAPKRQNHGRLGVQHCQSDLEDIEDILLMFCSDRVHVLGPTACIVELALSWLHPSWMPSLSRWERRKDTAWCNSACREDRTDLWCQNVNQKIELTFVCKCENQIMSWWYFSSKLLHCQLLVSILALRTSLFVHELSEVDGLLSRLLLLLVVPDDIRSGSWLWLRSCRCNILHHRRLILHLHL